MVKYSIVVVIVIVITIVIVTVIVIVIAIVIVIVIVILRQIVICFANFAVGGEHSLVKTNVYYTRLAGPIGKL